MPHLRHSLLGIVMLGLFLSLPPRALGQTDRPMIESKDTHYYDFWPGTWAEVVNGQADTSATMFTVRTSVHPAAFAEEWRQVYDGAAHHSTALRAWDQVTNRWMLVWVSDNALFQVWERGKEGEDWYIVKEFEIDGERFLSRQWWIPESPNRVVRVMERSFDGGHTWEPRFQTLFQRLR